MPRADVRIANHGSIVLVRPVTKAAEEWLNDNVGGEAQYFGNALACEPRYVGDLLHGMENDGLIVKGEVV